MSELENALSMLMTEWFEDGVKKKYIVELGGALNHVRLELFADSPVVYGQYASFCRNDDGTYDAVRDPLGIGKLFYTEAENGQDEIGLALKS